MRRQRWPEQWSSIYTDKLDGLGSSGKRKREGEHTAGLEDYLQLPDDYATRMSEPGKKRVIWEAELQRCSPGHLKVYLFVCEATQFFLM